MKLYNAKLKNIPEWREYTYFETVTVKNGFAEVHNPYSIRELKRRGFIEVAEPKSLKVEVKGAIATFKEEPSTTEGEKEKEKRKMKETRKAKATRVGKTGRKHASSK